MTQYKKDQIKSFAETVYADNIIFNKPKDKDDELTTYYGAGDFTHRAFQIYLSYGL